MHRLVSAVFAAALLTAPTGCDSKPAMTPEEQEAKFTRELTDAEGRVANNKLDDAKKILTRLLKERPDHPRATALLGAVHFHQGNMEEAETLLAKASTLDPSDANNQFLHGEVLRHADRHAEAATAYAAAFKLDPENSAYGLPLGIALIGAEKHAEAETVLREVLELDPQAQDENRTGANTFLGDALRGQKKNDEALAAYMKAQTVYQSDKKAFAGAAFVYEDKNDIKHALDQWAAYIQRDPFSDFSKNVARKKMMELKVPADEG